MAEHSEEIEHVRERIADRLFGQIHGQGITSPLLLADAVLAVLADADPIWRGENERLRDALGVILDGLTDALGNPMGARPSQVTTLYSIASHAMRPIHARNEEDGHALDEIAAISQAAGLDELTGEPPIRRPYPLVGPHQGDPMTEHSEDFDQATKQHLIDQARKQVDGLSRWSGGSLRLEAYRVIDTMNELVLLAEREHSGRKEGDCG